MMRADMEPFCRNHYTKMKDEWMDALWRGDLLARVCQGPAYDLRTTIKWTRKRASQMVSGSLLSGFLSQPLVTSWFLVFRTLISELRWKWWGAGLLAEPMFLELLATTTPMEILFVHGARSSCASAAFCWCTYGCCSKIMLDGVLTFSSAQ